MVGKCWHHPKIHFEDAIFDVFAVSRQNDQNFKDPEFPNRLRSGQKKFTHMFLGSLPTFHVNFNKIGGGHFSTFLILEIMSLNGASMASFLLLQAGLSQLIHKQHNLKCEEV